MALRSIEHLYIENCHCGARASRHRWRMLGAVGVVGVFIMAAAGHDVGSQAATIGTTQPASAVVSPVPNPTGFSYPASNFVTPAPVVPMTDATSSVGGCNVARVAGTPDACATGR